MTSQSEPSNLIEGILCWDNLCAAWEQVQANRGAPGVDGVTLARWARNWEANLLRLREQVKTNTYRPNRPKRFMVYKKGGGVRELSRLTVSDKVMQRAVLNVVDKIYEQRFLPCSHGYRENRSVATAVKQVLNYRDRGNRWVLDADILACFDRIDHSILINLIQRVIKEWFTLNLMELWLKAGRKHRNQASGTPMGGVISPLFCNIYLHQIDARLTCNRWNMVRYADDFVILTPSKEQTYRALDLVSSMLAKLKLELNPLKTEIVTFEEGFTFLGVHFYRDGYSYTWRDKRIQVNSKDVSHLYRRKPNFY